MVGGVANSHSRDESRKKDAECVGSCFISSSSGAGGHVINLKTAKSLGLILTPPLPMTADEIK
jgi:hypothetical protein